MIMIYIHVVYDFCRCMGWLVRFVHNRDLAVENIVTAYSRQTVILSTPHIGLQETVANLERVNVHLSKNSMFRMASSLQEAQHNLPGAYAVDVRETRRNTRVLRGTNITGETRESLRAICTRLGLPPPDFAEGIKTMDNGRSCLHPTFFVYICIYCEQDCLHSLYM